MRHFFTGLIIVLISFISLPSFASKVHEYRLDNGLMLLVKRDTRAPVVVSQVWYKVGSSYEPLGLTGISHALEHMMFEGTRNVDGKAFTKAIGQVGGSFNAATSRDYTVYFEKLPAKNLNIAFRLEADRMQHLLMTKKRFKKEIEVVKEERRMRVEDNPQSLTYERFLAAAFISSPYHHMTVGWMEDLNHMKLVDLRNWYEHWYAPGNAIVVVDGDVSPKAVYELAKQTFGKVPARRVPKIALDKEVNPLGRRSLDVNVSAKLPWLAMGYLVPTLTTAKHKWQAYALDVLAGVLDGGRSARLPRKLVREEEIATDIGLDYSIADRLQTQFVLAGTPAQGHSSIQLEKAILAQIHALQTKPVSAAELARVKAQVVAQKIFSQDSQSEQANTLGRLEVVGLPYKLAGSYVKHIEAVTAAQVQAVAKTFLTEERLTVANLIPKKETHQS